MRDADVVAAPTSLRIALHGELDSPAWLMVDWPGGPTYGISMRLGLSGGRVVCSGLFLGGLKRTTDKVVPEISAASLRQIPLGQILDVLSRKAKIRGYGLAERLPAFQRPTRLGPRGIPKERLAEVAKLYRRALREKPSAPVKWMSGHIRGPEGRPTPEPTVRRWLQRCRDLGYLGASTPGKAGEKARRVR